MRMPRYRDQGYDPCIWLGLFFGRTQIQDKGQWERQFCPFGTIPTQTEQSRCPGLKVPRRHLWLMSNSRPLWSSSRRWSGMVIDDLRCLCIGIWIAPGVFWLPHFLPTDVAPAITQTLESSTGAWSHKLFFQGIILCWRKTASQPLWAGEALNCQTCSSAGCYLLLAEK